MEIQRYIKTELLILIPVIYFIGVCFKKSKIPNKWIPLLLGISAILLTTIWVFATTDIMCGKDFAIAIFVSITQGILIAGASVYVNQFILQTKKDE